MRRLQATLLTLFVLFALEAKAQRNPPLKLIATTPLPDLVGDLEFFAADVKGNRLFLCAEDGKTVEVFDLRTGKRIHSIKGFVAPHDVLILPDSNKFIVTDGNEGFGGVELLSGETYAVIDKIKLPKEVDDGVFNPFNNYFYVESGSDEPGAKTHFLNIIDTKNFRLVGTITLPGNRNDAMAIDSTGKKLYANNAGTSAVIVVDLETRKVIASWPLPGTKGLNGLALDEANHRLFSATRNPPKLFVLNTDNGNIIATYPCASYNDHLTFDAPRKRIYITGDSASVFEQRDADHYDLIADIPTATRAKTSLYVPELNRLYIAISGKGNSGAKLAVQIYQVEP
jgi:DNA-binding beta-propeller fold protein YncE